MKHLYWRFKNLIAIYIEYDTRIRDFYIKKLSTGEIEIRFAFSLIIITYGKVLQNEFKKQKK